MLSTTINCPYTQAHIRNWLNHLIKYEQNYPDCDVEDAFYIVTNNHYNFMNTRWWLHAALYLIQKNISLFRDTNLEKIVNTIKNGFSDISYAYVLDPGCPLEKLHIPADIPPTEKKIFLEKLTHLIDGACSPGVTPLYQKHTTPINSVTHQKSIAPPPNFHL